MKILLATGIYPPQIGGPAQYAYNLAQEFSQQGQVVKVIHYDWEYRLPAGFRHLWFLLRVWHQSRGVDLIFALDTFSVGVPAAVIAALTGKKLVIRVGGDFLWESYVERSGNLIPLSQFYQTWPKLNLKEKLIFKLVRFALSQASGLAFTTDWQRQIWQTPYLLSRVAKVVIIDNYLGRQLPPASFPGEKVYLFAARPLKLKNLPALKDAFAAAQKKHPEISLKVLSPRPHSEFLAELAKSYAVLIPSISEISPNLAWEALRYQKPFLLTQECGYAKRLADVAVLVNPLDRTDLVEKISQLADENIYRQKQERIAAWTEERSWTEVANDFLTLFSTL